MKNIKYVLTFLLFIFYLNPVYSQANIATLDVFKLLKDSKAAISITDQLNAVAKKYEGEGQEKQKTIQKQEEELLRQKSTLTPEAFLDRKNTFEKKVIEFNKDTQTKRKNITVARKKAIEEVEKEVEVILKKIIETDKITAVIKKTSIVLSEDSIDITQKVIDELDKKLSSVKVNITP